MSGKGGTVVLPFPDTKASLGAAQRDWMSGSSRTQRLASRIVEVLDRAEQGLQAVEAALHEPHPASARLGSFLRGELSREDNRAVVRHLLTGCAARPTPFDREKRCLNPKKSTMS